MFMAKASRVRSESDDQNVISIYDKKSQGRTEIDRLYTIYTIYEFSFSYAFYLQFSSACGWLPEDSGNQPIRNSCSMAFSANNRLNCGLSSAHYVTAFKFQSLYLTGVGIVRFL